MAIRILIGTGNRHKFEEISSIMKGLKDRASFIFANDIFGNVEIVEDSKTYGENAEIKIKGYLKLISETPELLDKLFIDYIVSEDTGLEVACLNNEPGIYTARYAGENAASSENIAKLLSAMDVNNKCKKDRKARFVCVACLYDMRCHSSEFFEGILNGSISNFPRGKNGFGYDPVFFIPELDKTLAEISEAKKHKISHRAKAFRKIAAAIEHRR